MFAVETSTYLVSSASRALSSTCYSEACIGFYIRALMSSSLACPHLAKTAGILWKSDLENAIATAVLHSSLERSLAPPSTCRSYEENSPSHLSADIFLLLSGGSSAASCRLSRLSKVPALRRRLPSSTDGLTI